MRTINELSEQLLLAVKMQNKHEDLIKEISIFPLERLEDELVDDERKKAFWINAYNAFFQILRKTHNLKQPEIYREKRIIVSNQKLSLDDIEHGILRRYRYKYSMGYFANPFAPSMIKRWAVDTIDYRIHFALNCGAKSCPPIAFYSVDRLKMQLEMASLSFIESDTIVNNETKEVWISSIYKWFKKDFGGNSGIKRILSNHLKTDLNAYKIGYNPYSWEEALDNYDEEKFQSSEF
jgi:hypothetical protein